jgi:S1-C subfamily serine protease
MGILQGDIITKVDDKNIHNPKDLVDAIASYKPGDVVDITFERSNKMMTKKATLDKQSENMTFRRSMPFGDDLFDMNPMFKQFNTEMLSNSPNAAPSPKIGVSVEDRADGEGVLVEEVNENSAAAKSGIEKGDVITEFGSSSIHSVDELMDAIQQNQNKGKVDVTVKRKGVSKKMALTIPKNLKKKEL